MARRTQPPIPAPAHLNQDQMRQAIPKLKRRIEESRAVNLDDLADEIGDDTVHAMENKINATLLDIFGYNTIAYNQYQATNLVCASIVINGRYNNYKRRLPYIKKSVASAIANLDTIIDLFEERLTPHGNDLSGIIHVYEGLALHRDIERAASKLYLDGHYSNAVEAAVKALNNLVRLRTGLEIDGTSLMEKTFSINTPLLKFNDLLSQLDKDEQKGFMYLFSGAVSGLRNPRAHGFINDDPERALEFIAFVSLLAKLLDEAKP